MTATHAVINQSSFDDATKKHLQSGLITKEMLDLLSDLEKCTADKQAFFDDRIRIGKAIERFSRITLEHIRRLRRHKCKILYDYRHMRKMVALKNKYLIASSSSVNNLKS